MPMPSDSGTMRVEFTLNGKPVSIDTAPADRLLDTLRYALGLTGSKEGCGEGECGACTVYMDGIPANSCLVPTFQVHGRTIETIESIAPAHVESMADSGATQCGACTPGVVLSACWIKKHPELLESHTVRALMAGNLCRCTGYDGIMDGIEADMRKKGNGS